MSDGMKNEYPEPNKKVTVYTDNDDFIHKGSVGVSWSDSSGPIVVRGKGGQVIGVYPYGRVIGVMVELPEGDE